MTSFIKLNRIISETGRLILLAVSLFIVVPLAYAQQPPAAGAPQGGQQLTGQQKEFMQTRAELQQLQQQLGEIQKQALDDNPELQKQQEAFRELMLSTMKNNGHTPDADLNRLKQLRSEIQGSDIPKDKRQKLIKEFRKTNMALQQAQQEAMKNGEVQQAQKSLNNAVLTAMVETNPETQKLISQLRQARQRLMQIRKEVMSSQNQPQQDQGGQ